VAGSTNRPRFHPSKIQRIFTISKSVFDEGTIRSPNRRSPVNVQGMRRMKLTPRGLIVSATALVVAVAAALVGIVLSRSSDVPARGSLTGALPGAPKVQELLAGISQHDNVLGNVLARVTMVEYVDLQSPGCREFQTRVLPQLLDRYVRRGNLKVEVRLTRFIGRDSERGRAAAIAAGEQNRFFDFVQVLFDNQGAENSGWLDDGMVTAAAASVPGLDVPRLRHERNSLVVDDVERGYDGDAADDEVRSTPTVLVGKRGKVLRRVALAGPSDERAVAAAIEAARG
jgi:protein-disulfide isomerase